VKKSVALGYNKDKDIAPRVLAKGHGAIATYINTLAEEKNIPVVENPELVNSLMGLDLNQWIPEEFYQAVSEVIRFVYGLERKG